MSATPAWEQALAFLGASHCGIYYPVPNCSGIFSLCMTDPFVKGMLEGRVLDASSCRSEEFHILQVTTVSACGSWSQDGDEPVE